MERFFKTIIVVLTLYFESSDTLKDLQHTEVIDCNLNKDVFYKTLSSDVSRRSETILIDLAGESFMR